jgi:putative ABC transport system substrate-binding protein
MPAESRGALDLIHGPPHHPRMDRRAFLLTLLAGVLATPLASRAQQTGKVWRIGWLVLEQGDPAGVRKALREQLRALGYIEGKNVIFEYRVANSDPSRFPALAAELVAMRVDVIVAGGEAVRAAKSATTMIPIVMPWVLEAVETGVVESLARPGGNVTGLTWEEGTDQAKKKLEIFKQASVSTSRLALLWDPSMPGLARYVPPLRTAATTLGMVLQSVEYSSAEEVDRALATVLRDRPSGVFFAGDALTTFRAGALCQWALENRLPTLASNRNWVEAGCLISYAVNPWDLYRRAAVYVDKILKGARPADLPVEQPTKYELVINLKTAKALGLTIPPSLLARADQVIE